MNRYLFQLLFFIIALPTFAQSFRYSESVFDSVDTLKDVEFARAEWLNSPLGFIPKYNIHYNENVTEVRPLKMDVFFPRGDTLSLRPAVVFLHGGAFLLGSRHNDDMIAFCDSFARKGYVTATIDYRIGMAATVSSIFGIPVGIKLENKNTYRAVYRAVQDSRAAVRFLKYRAEDYGIDTTKIFLVGSSAGAIAALQHLYWDNDAEVPPDVFLSPSLGDLDAVGIQGYSSKPAGVASLWGALQDPGIIGNEATPIFLVHGTDDDIVPFKMGIPLAGIVPDFPNVNFSMPPTFGSFCIDTALNNRAIEHDTYFVDGKKHEFYGVDTGRFGEDGPNQYWDTIQTKMTGFFLKQFRPNADFIVEKQGLNVDFTNSSSGIFYSEWDFGDGHIGTGNLTSHTYSKTGIYRVKLTACNSNLACDTLTKWLELDPLVSATELGVNNLLVYPNPVRRELNVSGINPPFKASIYDITGRIQMVKKEVANAKIDVGQLQNGVYFLHVKMGNETFVRKFVKVNK